MDDAAPQERHVTAAGGYVLRPGLREPEVLMIFRRGVWDLPKGKQDAGESVAACALREVREEVGVKTLTLGEALGTTVHTYVRHGCRYRKTTYWFSMHTRDTSFQPQKEEDIERVAWVSWSEAIRRVGYLSLQEHMRRVTSQIVQNR